MICIFFEMAEEVGVNLQQLQISFQPFLLLFETVVFQNLRSNYFLVKYCCVCLLKLLPERSGVLLQYIYEVLRCTGWFPPPPPPKQYSHCSLDKSEIYFFTFPCFCLGG